MGLSITKILTQLFSGPKVALAEPNTPPDWQTSKSWMKWKAPLKIVSGQSHYQSTFTAILGEPRPAGYLKPVVAVLRREPENKYDRNAIAVFISDNKVGYMAKDIASQLAASLDKAKCSEFQLAAVIRGGYSKRPSFGVSIWINKLISPGPSLSFDRAIEENFSAPNWPPDKHEGLSKDEIDVLKESKPATAMQKEFYKFFGLSVPKGLNQKQAISFQFGYLSKLPEERQSEVEEWEAFEELFEEINEEFQDEIKKVTVLDYRNAFKALRAENSIDDLQSDPALIVEKLIEIRPALERP
ncbi:MAG: hypothetical protein DDT25_00785 [Chloroflexi bacterium]|nr:hypothetical protein [Chloroflexota bacterium]